MNGMVLAAGRGERMRPLSYRMAKTAMPVLNRPLVSYALRVLSRAGVEHTAVNLHHLPDTVERAVRRCTPDGMEVTVFREETLLGTAGGVRNAESVLRNGVFLLTNGDFVFEVEPAEVLETHRKSGAVATMVLLPFQEHLGYRPVEVIDGRIVRIAGHPERDGPEGTKYIFSGLHAVDSSLLDQIPAGEPFDMNRGLYASLLRSGGHIAAHVVDGPWLEFGTPGGYLRRTLHLLSPPLRPMLERLGIDVTGESHDASVIGEDVKLSGSGSLRDGVVLGDGVSVGREVKIRRSIIWPGAKLGYGSDISDSILGEDVILPPNSRFHHKIVMARGDDIPEDARGERQGDLVFFPL
jgi:mannose-1-phosphate guanylyltransferase